MQKEKDLIEFDDNDAIKFILESLPSEQKGKIDEDTVQYVLDSICDYYEENGLFEDDDTVDEAEIAQDDMFNYIYSIIQQEKEVKLSAEQLQLILDLEFEYGVNIGIYSEE
ncbi:MAG: hypothetical protein LBT04_09830 [Prevotellaceae bacterium]|jgi:hypothetical protein|nr:hypothetical protein [Prevotellaceae bacterium]